MNMIRVLIEQKKSYFNEKKELVKTNEYSTFNYKGHVLPKIGGIVEDNTKEILGFVYAEEKYDIDGNRKKEFMAPYDWTNSNLKIDKETIHKYEIKNKLEEIA